MRSLLTTLVLFASTAVGAWAQNYVTTFGDYGWYSDDTRDGSVTAVGGANELLGLTSSHPSYGTGSAEDDLLIADRIKWETPALNAPNGLGALHLSTLTPSTGRLSSGKATLSLVNATSGFAAASTLTNSNFYASLTYYNPANKQLALRINVQSTLWTGAQPTNILGENTWDLALVYVGKRNRGVDDGYAEPDERLVERVQGRQLAHHRRLAGRQDTGATRGRSDLGSAALRRWRERFPTSSSAWAPPRRTRRVTSARSS